MTNKLLKISEHSSSFPVAPTAKETHFKCILFLRQRFNFEENAFFLCFFKILFGKICLIGWNQRFTHCLLLLANMLCLECCWTRK